MRFEDIVKPKAVSHDDGSEDIVKDFVDFSCQKLKIGNRPVIKLIKDPDQASIRKSFGGYSSGNIEIIAVNRHIMDVLRTLAHELVHYKQDSDGVLTPDSGKDGSEHENEANARAAVIMRLWAKMNPDLFKRAAILAESFNTEIDEYEQGTQRSREIEQVLTQAGYTMLGGGADATAWAKDDGRVIKIIMSDGDSNKPAMKTFKRFLKLTQARPSPHWPRFFPMRDEQGRSSVFAKFRIGNRNYLQIAMEQLEDIDYEEGEIIEMMSAYIQDNRDLGQFLRGLEKYHDARDWVKKNSRQIPGLWQAVKDAYSKANWDYEWDLHGGNVMKRADGTYVITDPWIRWG